MARELLRPIVVEVIGLPSASTKRWTSTPADIAQGMPFVGAAASAGSDGRLVPFYMRRLSLGMLHRRQGSCTDDAVTDIGQALARHLELLGDLSAEDREALVAVDGKVQLIPVGQDILSKGDHPTSSIIVLEGLLHRYTDTLNGSRQIHEFYLPPDAPCLETLYLDYMDNSLAATVQSRIGVIPHDQLYALIETRPGVRKLIWRQTLVQAAMFREWLVRNSTKQATASLAHFVCEMFLRSQMSGLASDYSFDLRIGQLTLSEALGLTTVHTNRSLKVLRESGLIEWGRGKVTILDWARLSRLAEFDRSYLHFHHGRASAAEAAHVAT